MANAKGGGLWHMTLAALFFSVMSLLVRIAGESMPSQQIVLARAAVALVLSFAIVKQAGLSWRGNNRRLLFLRGLFGFGALSCFYWSLTHMPLAEATVIQYMNPIFTAILAAIFLREQARWVEIAGVVVSLAGVVLVAKPRVLFSDVPGEPIPAFAVGVALLGALLSAAAYVAVRKSHGGEHAHVVVLWFPLVATPLAVPFAIGNWVTPSWSGWLLLLGVGVSTQIAQMFMTEGLHREPAGRATAMSYLQIVFAVALGVAFLREWPDRLTLAGAVLIGAGVMSLALFPKRPKPEVAPPLE